MKFLLRPWFYLVVLLATNPATNAQLSDEPEIVTARLLADTSQVTAGTPFSIGVLLNHAPGWHSYWQNPGDSGLATEVKWQLPPGFTVGPLQWPMPHLAEEGGGMIVYSYGDELLLMATITPPADLPAGEMQFGATVDWLVCKELCVPGSAEVALTLSTQGDGDGSAALFAKFRAQLPSLEPPPFAMKWSQQAGQLTLTLEGVDAAASVEFFPLPTGDVRVGHPTVTSGATDGQRLVTIPLTTGDPESMAGVVVTTMPGQERRGWQIGGGKPSPASIGSSVDSVRMPEATGFTGWGSLLKFLFYGFLGGMLLNLMPCVLPVISLKIFGFIKQADEKPAKVFRLGLAFVAGIFAWFIGLAIVIVGLRMAGNEVSWSFQFQNAYFNIFMCAVIFVFALNLLGVFEVYLPGSANSKLVDLAQREGYAGAFLHGVFATILATPCTAPFLGSALGFAFSQSSLTVFVMFLAVAAGMGAPFIVLTARPSWMKFLPRPGKWMEQVKQFMGFLLLATMLWLLRVVGHQVGVDALIWICGFLLVLGLASWMIGSFITPVSSPRAKRTVWLLVAVMVVGSGWAFLSKQTNERPQATGQNVGFQQSLDQLLAGDDVIFVDFTAEWCLTCKFNERTVVHTPEVEAAMAKYGVQFLKADWTNGDPEITAVLKQYGRAGVPFYLVLPAGGRGTPIALPEVITKEMLIRAFAKAAASSP